MSGIIQFQMLGGFGGMLSQFAFAKSYAEKYGFELQCDPWIGEQVFDLPAARRPDRRLPGRTLLGLSFGEGDVDIQTYATHQRAIIYTRTQVRQRFVIKPELKEILEKIIPLDDEVVAHRRTWDYIANQTYTVISRASYYAACKQYGYDPDKLRFVEYETPLTHPAFAGPLVFLPDFYRLMKAPVLFRGNSGFSWWAAVLGDHQAVYSPVIVGLKTGVEQDAPFVPGNAPKVVDGLDFVSDIELAP